MWRFLLKDVRGERAHFLTTLGFFVTSLAVWSYVAPTASDSAPLFFWILLVFCLHYLVQMTLLHDSTGGFIKNLMISPFYLGHYIVLRFASLAVVGIALLGSGLLCFALFFNKEIFLDPVVLMTSFVCHLSLLFFVSFLTLFSKGSFLLGTFLGYPLMLPIFLLTFLAQTDRLASILLTGSALALMPASVGGAMIVLHIHRTST
ncbi:MAG: hypothetical protein ACK5TR_02235 [Alphaproteobacteria bacterium]|jgi:hypothetical protein|nr:hypothetical protein [Alphaproteobacteria bacterium]